MTKGIIARLGSSLCVVEMIFIRDPKKMVVTKQNETRSTEDMQEVLRQLLPGEFSAPKV